jgi:hypothetical protein
VDYFDSFYVHTVNSESYSFGPNGNFMSFGTFSDLGFSHYSGALAVMPEGTLLTVGSASNGGTLPSSWISDAVGNYDGVILVFEGNSIQGDLNGDGIRNVADVTVLAGLITAGNPPPIQIADIDGDGAVNMSDVAALAAMIANNP